MSAKGKREEYLISLSDIGRIVRKRQRQILAGALLMGIVAFGYAITRPVFYIAEASFKDKGRTSSGPKTMSDFFSSGQQQDSDNMTLLKSDHLTEEVVKRLGLQAHIAGTGESFPFIKLLYKNLKTEYANQRERHYPLFKDYFPSLRVRDVTYNQELPKTYVIKLKSSSEYTVEDNAHVIGSGTLNEPFTSEEIGFTLKTVPGQPLEPEYRITFNQLRLTADNQMAMMTILPDKLDKSLVRLTYKHRNRYDAQEFLNELMTVLQQYLKDEDNRYAQKQLDYLKMRHDETFENQAKFLKSYAEELANDLSQTGYASTDKEMTFLAKNHHQYSERLVIIELELKHIQDILNNEALLKGNFAGVDLTAINPLIKILEEQRQQRDSLSIALQQYIPHNEEHVALQFEQQIANLENLNQSSKEIKSVIGKLNANEPINPNIRILNDPNLLVKAWLYKVQACEEAWRDAPSNEKSKRRKEWEIQKANCLSYLTNLDRLNDVHAQLIHERLSHHYDPKLEFQGIDLDTAKQLYLTYSRDSSNLEADLRQNSFIIKQLEDPDAEISSLSAILKDSVSNEIIAKSSALALTLRDTENRSLKELARVKEELALQKKFLSEHLQQMNLMLELRKNLLDDKMYSLQGVTLELIHQKISIIQKHINDFLNGRITNLYNERKIIENHLADINQKMATLPKKWVSEEILHQNLSMNKAVVEEITKMVESKNISHHLEFVKSAPLDYAALPMMPKAPKVLFLTLLGAFAGALLTLMFFVLQAMLKGVEVSQTNLNASGQFVAGRISKQLAALRHDLFTDQDLGTLRRLIARFEQGSHSLLIVEGGTLPLAWQMARLLRKQGLKVAYVDISFDQPSKPEDHPALLQVLEGAADKPKWTTQEGIAVLPSGGISRFSNELLNSQRFKALQESLKQEYDWVLYASRTRPDSVQAETLLNVFSQVVLVVTNERLLKLQSYIDRAERLAFVMQENN